MATPEERLKILKMIQSGKLSAEQGAQLLEALGDTTTQAASFPEFQATPQRTTARPAARWFRVVITNKGTGKTNVNLRLPVSLIQAGKKMGARISPETADLDMRHLEQLIEAGKTGKVVDVEKDDGRHIEVYLE